MRFGFWDIPEDMHKHEMAMLLSMNSMNLLHGQNSVYVLLSSWWLCSGWHWYVAAHADWPGSSTALLPGGWHACTLFGHNTAIGNLG